MFGSFLLFNALPVPLLRQVANGSVQTAHGWIQTLSAGVQIASASVQIASGSVQIEHGSVQMVHGSGGLWGHLGVFGMSFPGLSPRVCPFCVKYAYIVL